jgi:CHAD domain-containing protein/transposase-like protein
MAIFDLTPEQRHELEMWTASGLDRYERRARIILFYAEGHMTGDVARMVGMSPGRVRYWRRQFHLKGLGIFPSSLPSQGSQQSESVMMPEAEPPSPEATEAGAQMITTQPAAAASKADRKAARKARGKTRRGAKREPGAGSEPAQPKMLPYPKPTAKPGVQPDDSMAEAGRKTLRFHFTEMLAHEAGTRLGEDIEELHDMRVATRRMRAAFDIFLPAYDARTIKPFVRGLKTTGRALGSVRDLDVFMEKADHYLESLPEGGLGGLDPLLDEWHAQRAAARERMIHHLDNPEYETFKRGFSQFLQTEGAGTAAASPAAGEPLPFAQEAVRFEAPMLIYTRLSTVRAYDQILDNASILQLHALRIEFKRLRYLLEFFNEVLGEEAKQVINEIKRMQDHLGDLHDADVACQILNQFLEDWEVRQETRPLQGRQNPEPIVAYLAARYAERHHLLVSFPEAWQSFNRPELRRNLALAIAVL